MKKVSLICVFTLVVSMLCMSVALAFPNAQQVNGALKTVPNYARIAIPSNGTLGLGVGINDGGSHITANGQGFAVNSQSMDYKVLGIGVAYNEGGAFNTVNAIGADIYGVTNHALVLGAGVAINDGGIGNTVEAMGASVGNGWNISAIGVGFAYNEGSFNTVRATGVQVQSGFGNTAYGVGIAINDGGHGNTVTGTGGVVWDPAQQQP